MIKKFLKHQCLTWAHMIHLNTYNISYGQKKGRESKCQFDSWPLKVRNHPELGVCKWCVTYIEKILTRVTTLLQTSPQLEVCMRSYGLPKWRESQFWEFWDSRKNWHLGVAHVANHREYYKGENGGFPQVWAVMSLMNLCMFVVHPCTKSVPIIH